MGSEVLALSIIIAVKRTGPIEQRIVPSSGRSGPCQEIEMSLILKIAALVLLALAIVGVVKYAHYFGVTVPQQIQTQANEEQAAKQQRIDDVTVDTNKAADVPRANMEEEEEQVDLTGC
jgi:cytochrome c-type biogenesis protein CcmH/NrfG